VAWQRLVLLSVIVKRPRDTAIEDETLIALRQQLGEVAWNERLAQAAEREAVVLRVQKMLRRGLAKRSAIDGAGATVSPGTVQRWLSLYERDGLAALVDRRGRVATHAPSRPRAPAANLRGAARSPRRGGRSALSFVKWVGSKAQVMPRLLAVMPESYGTYYEPMAGSGTVFMSLKPKRAVLGDTNAELMNCYRVIRDQLAELIIALKVHENSYEHFIAVRAQQPDDLPPVQRAARTIFLNKTCFNGLYRLNRSGRFNVPYGKMPNANYCDIETLERISRALKRVRLACGDYAKTVQRARAGDLVYFDPPYLSTNGETFTRYQATRFDDLEHQRLAELCRELDERGCYVVASNADNPRVRQLYRGFHKSTLTTTRFVNSKASNRTGWKELVIWNFDARTKRTA
jgi:DNA adenine methylase